MCQYKRYVVLGAAVLAVAGAAGALIAGGYFTPRAADSNEQGDAKPVPFDGKRAMDYLKAVCDIGPRISGTAGMRKQQDLIRKHFEALGAKVEGQTFTAKQRSRKEPVEMTNLIVRFHPEKARRVIICSHYDTRPIADQEPNEAKWREPFVSANDGGSGVALLMELGNHMKNLPVNLGVDFVFFDGEEYIWDTKKKDDYFFGSKHFAETWKRSKDRPEYAGAILLDMVGGKVIRFPKEVNSLTRAKRLTEEVWKIAAELKCTAFKNEEGYDVLDDHLSLLDVGIPAIDIIDFSYDHWHRLSDTPESCSGDSLAEVSRVLSVWLQRAK